MEIIKIRNKNSNILAVESIKAGGVIACPTDTVYGLLADATNKKAVTKIYKIKERPKSKFLPVFVKDLKMAKDLAFIDKEQEGIINKKWPGKYTFILERKKGIKLYGVDKNTIAIRIPKYKFLNNLLKKIDKPLVQTSVNISGESSLIKINDIMEVFTNRKSNPEVIIDAGNLLKNKSSTIIDLTKNNIKIIRK